MKLVVVGRELLDVLEHWVRTRFTAVPRRDYEPPRITTPLHREGLLPAWLDVEPIREIRTISLSFAIPPLRPYYRAKPFALASHLLGHEGRASPLRVLDVPGLALVVQSPSTPPEALHRHVDSFLHRSGAALRDMPSAVFERHRAAVESTLLEAETRLDQRTERYWGEIDREHYEFDRRERLLGAVRAVTRDGLADVWRDLVTAPETARGVVVAVSNHQPPSSDRTFRGAEPVADPGAFKRGQRCIGQ